MRNLNFEVKEEIKSVFRVVRKLYRVIQPVLQEPLKLCEIKNNNIEIGQDNSKYKNIYICLTSWMTGQRRWRV